MIDFFDYVINDISDINYYQDDGSVDEVIND